MLVTANIFQPLIDVFESVLKFFHSTGGISWGWSIVLLTVCVRAVLVPLTFRQIKSMVRMQALAPQLKEIQQKYKEDRQKQSEETMKFYRENNVNPLSSCLPLILQLPVFVSLYYMLRESLRNDICPQIQHHYQHLHHTTNTIACGGHGGASFLFIPDLTNKATGIALVALIILYVGTQLGSTLVMSAASTMDPMQRRLMLFLPLIFVLFVFRFPAGVLVYWITTNLWTMAQQWVVRQRIGPRLAVAGGDTIDSTASPPSPSKRKPSGARSGPSAGSGSRAGSGAGSRASGAAAKRAGAKETGTAASAKAGAAAKTSGDRGADGSDDADRTSIGGSFASLFRGRQQEQPDASGSAAVNGGEASGNGSDRSKSGVGSRSGSGSSAARSGSGSRSGRSGSSAGDSSAGKSSSSSSGRAGGKPPPPPRKRKKRSGRRR